MVLSRFGDLVAQGDRRVSWLGIMNASRLPLQRHAYPANGADRRANIPAWSEFAKCLPYVRGKRPVTERNEAALLMERASCGTCRRGLDGIPAGNGLLLVCCGEFAQRIFERTRVRDTIRSPTPRTRLATSGRRTPMRCGACTMVSTTCVDWPGTRRIRKSDPKAGAVPRRASDHDRPREHSWESRRRVSAAGSYRSSHCLMI